MSGDSDSGIAPPFLSLEEVVFFPLVVLFTVSAIREARGEYVAGIEEGRGERSKGRKEKKRKGRKAGREVMPGEKRETGGRERIEVK
jgi:hypothetical protein